MANKVVHFEVTGSDGKSLRKFYGDLFGWKFNEDFPIDYGVVEASEGTISGGIGAAQEGPGMVTFYVDTDDIPKSLEQAESLGATTVAPEMEVPGGVKIGLFADPEGHVIGLVAGM